MALCGVLAAMCWPKKPEPVYQGRKLSEWLVEPVDPATGLDSPGAIEAVLAIGTNGTPVYVQWLAYDGPSFLKKVGFQIAEKTPDWLPLNWLSQDSEFARKQAAFWAIGKLGKDGVAVFQQFLVDERNFERLSREENASLATRTVEKMGGSAVPFLSLLMTNQNPRVRATAIGMFMRMGDTSLMAQIRISLQDSDRRVRSAATNVMRTYDPHFGVPIHNP